MYDHTHCPPTAHDRDPGTALDDGQQSVDEHGLLLCNDCTMPLMYCTTFGDYDHVDPNTPPCFLVPHKTRVNVDNVAVEDDELDDDEVDDVYSTPEFLAYLDILAADDRRAAERAGKPPPMQWGTKLDNDHHFCLPCWYAGYANGAHSYDMDACELAPRGPFDPR